MHAMATSRPYRGALPDDRRADRRRRLLGAGLELVGTVGWSATTVRGVCEAAAVGPRFFYESFDDLDALGVALIDEAVADALGHVLAGIATVDEPADRFRTGLRIFLGRVTDDPRRARLLFAEAHASEALTRRRFHAIRTVADAVAAQARSALGLKTAEARALPTMALVLTGGIAEAVLAWIDGEVDLTRDELIDVCTELALALGDRVPAASAHVRARRPRRA